MMSNDTFTTKLNELNMDYWQIKSPIYGNEELLKQCQGYTVIGKQLNEYDDEKLGVYCDCYFNNDEVYSISVLNGIVVDIF